MDPRNSGNNVMRLVPAYIAWIAHKRSVPRVELAIEPPPPDRGQRTLQYGHPIEDDQSRPVVGFNRYLPSLSSSCFRILQ